jgi:hypothetical protein
VHQKRRREAVPDAIDDEHTVVEPNLRQQQQELLPAGPAQVILCPHPRPAGPRKVLEDCVARLVPMRIVNGLEVLNVDHSNAQTGSPTLVSVGILEWEYWVPAALDINNETNGRFVFALQMSILKLRAPEIVSQRWEAIVSKEMFKAPQILNSNAYSQIRCS